MRNLIVDRESEAWILTKARANWFITLQEDWIIKVLRWETTLDEIHRVIE
jgi:type II secretory ATPase GspE/PulE/Tfp pilus assembly ATPase PilB-like protein